MEKVPNNLMGIFPKINLLILEKVMKFCTIRQIKELLKKMLFNDELIEVFANEKKNALVLFQKCFKNLGFSKRYVLVDAIMSHALYTNTEEVHHQHPHTDYMYPALKNRTIGISGYHFTWTAIVPANIAETCLNIWEKAGYHMSIHIKFRECSYSDLI